MPAQAKAHLSINPDTSYATRDNIAVPTVTLGRSATVVATNAATAINAAYRSTVDTDVTISNIDTPASVAA